jgi:hypothetical protein
VGNPSWLDELLDQLKRQELPPPYVERLWREFSDHLHDIQEEKQGMDAEMVYTPNVRMGEPSDLAQFIGSEFRKQSFSQKHPIVTFAVMPVLLLLGIWFALGLLLVGIGSMFEERVELVADRFAEAGSLTKELICCGVIWLPLTLTTLIFCRAAQRRGFSWRWSMLSAATLAIFPGMTVRLSASMLAVGVVPLLSVKAILQFMLPLAIGSWYSWRGYRLLKA